MRVRQIRFDSPSVSTYLASPATKARLAEILLRWGASQRPAIVFVVDGNDLFAEVLAEDDLLGNFPDAPVVHVEALGRIAPGLLLIFVVDRQGATIYTIADPRAAN